MSLFDASALVVLGAWLLVSAVGQIRLQNIQALRAWDFLGLVPMWWFFAPTPPRGDVHLLFRDRLSDGAFTQWREIRVGGGRHWWDFVWNPRRRERKAFLDIASTLADDATRLDSTTIQLSLGYLALLIYVSSQPRTEASVLTQFLVMITDVIEGDGEPMPAILSNLHRLSSGEPD